MKILICTDIEGVAGVTTFGVDTGVDGRNYLNARRLLTEEVNAAVRGFLAAGATEIIVVDGHGPGAIDFELLRPPAKLLHGRPLAPIRQRFAELAPRIDAVAMVGQHAMAGVRDGNLNHTQNSATVESYRLNGQLIGETAQFALFYGALGKPLVFFSGDAAAVREAEALVPGLTTAAVKEGMGRNCALSLTAPVARELIERQAATAVARHRQTPLAPLAWPGPYRLEKRYFHTDVADAAADYPGSIRIDDRTVALESDDLTAILYA